MTKFLSVTSITAIIGMLAVILSYFGVEVSAEDQADLVANATEAVSGISFIVIFIRNIVSKIKAKE